MWTKVCFAMSDKWEYNHFQPLALQFWIALWCLFQERASSLAWFMIKQVKYSIKRSLLLMWDRPSVTAHTISSNETLTYIEGGWFHSRIFQRTLTNPKPVYSSCFVPHHRPWFEPVCTGIELTATPCAEITNLAPLHFAASFVFRYPTPACCIYKEKANV